jgi:hypothetical protein
MVIDDKTSEADCFLSCDYELYTLNALPHHLSGAISYRGMQEIQQDISFLV